MSLMQYNVDACEGDWQVHNHSVDFCVHFSCGLACLLMNCMSLWLIYGVELDINGWVWEISNFFFLGAYSTSIDFCANQGASKRTVFWVDLWWN